MLKAFKLLLEISHLIVVRLSPKNLSQILLKEAKKRGLIHNLRVEIIRMKGYNYECLLDKT